MYCKNCGQQIDKRTAYCPYCGTNTTIGSASCVNDAPSAGFAVLGFFIPLVGLILYLVYESKQPKRAKSAGKGALIGFITKIVLLIIVVTLYVIFTASLFSNITSIIQSNAPVVGDVFKEETTDEILEKYVNINFGKFTITNNGYYDETSLEVTVKNISDKQSTFFMTIEAVDKNDARLETDTVYADRLNAGQSISLKAFEYVEKDKIDEFKNASFKVLDIQYYN